MRKSLILLPLLLCTSPALAQPPAPQLPPQLTDPALADRLVNVMQTLSNVFFDLPVGQVKAAVEGRQATPAERNMTVRELARRDDPYFDRKVQRQIAEAGPRMRQGIKTLNDELPAMMEGLERAQKSFERAIANMPDPAYPKR